MIKPELAKKIKPLAASKRLSDFINRCIEEHFAVQAKEEFERRLAESYDRANEEGQAVAREFAVAETEDWPEW